MKIDDTDKHSIEVIRLLTIQNTLERLRIIIKDFYHPDKIMKIEIEVFICIALIFTAKEKI